MATQPQVRQSVLDDARRELALMVQRDTAAFGDARVFQQAFASNVDAKAAALGTSSAAAPSGAADTRDAEKRSTEAAGLLVHGDNTFTSWDTSDDTSAAAAESLGGSGSAFSSGGGGGGGGGGTGSGTGTEDVGALEEAIQQLSNTNAAVMSQNVTLTQELEAAKQLVKQLRAEKTALAQQLLRLRESVAGEDEPPQ